MFLLLLLTFTLILVISIAILIKKKILKLSIGTIILFILFLLSILTILGIKKFYLNETKEYDYQLRYYNENNRWYHINQINNKIIVDVYDQPICIKDPCPSIYDSTYRTFFKQDNMNKIYDFIKKYGKYHKSINLTEGNLTLEELAILKSVIYNKQEVIHFLDYDYKLLFTRSFNEYEIYKRNDIVMVFSYSNYSYYRSINDKRLVLIDFKNNNMNIVNDFIINYGKYKEEVRLTNVEEMKILESIIENNESKLEKTIINQ